MFAYPPVRVKDSQSVSPAISGPDSPIVRPELPADHPEASPERDEATGEGPGVAISSGRVHPQRNESQLERFIGLVMDPALGKTESRLFNAKSAGRRIHPAKSGSKDCRTFAGWFGHPAYLLAATSKLNGVSAYVIPNACRPHANKLVRECDNAYGIVSRATTDDEIPIIRWLFVDFDFNRPTETSATDAEVKSALSRRDDFLGEWPSLSPSVLTGCSGNGAWVLARLPDLKNDDAGRDITKRMTHALVRIYSDTAVGVDVRCKNPARLMCLPGTLKCKGTFDVDRPWRLATLDQTEGDPIPIDSDEFLAKLLEKSPEPVVESRRSKSASVGGGTGLALIGEPGLDGATIVPGETGLIKRVKRQAASYLAKKPGGIQGQNGSAATFDAACVLVQGFALSAPDAFLILKEWSETTCVPPWSDQELAHKIDDAAKKTNQPRGHLRNPDGPELALLPGCDDEEDGQGGPGVDEEDVVQASEETDPFRLAIRILREIFTDENGKLLIRYWHSEYWVYRKGAYAVASSNDLTSRVANYLAREFRRIYRAAVRNGGDQDGKSPVLNHVTGRVVADVLLAIRGEVLVDSYGHPVHPAWMGQAPWPAVETMPASNALIHLPSLLGGTFLAVEPTPDFFCPYSLGFPYLADAPEPAAWLAFLDSVFGDDHEQITLLREWLGYLLTSDTSMQKMLWLIGPPGSGKGTILRVTTELIGRTNTANPSLNSLNTHFGRAELLGKPSIIVTDARFSSRADGTQAMETILAITGEDSISIPRKFLPAVTAKINAKFTLASNEMPEFVDPSLAFVSRILVLRLVKEFRRGDARTDRNLTEKLKAELPSILTWAVEGYKSLRERGRFHQPAAGLEILAGMEELTSPINTFVIDRCELAESATIRPMDLYKEWQSWCTDRGYSRICTQPVFGKMLAAKFPGSIKRKQVRTDGTNREWVYSGIRLSSDWLIDGLPQVEVGPADFRAACR